MQSMGNKASAGVVLLAGVLTLPTGWAWAAPELPAGLISPDQRVVCHPGRGVCYDRLGPSIGLTEVFLGKAAAERLLSTLREKPVDQRPGARFSPAEGVECVRETGPCRFQGQTHAVLSAALFGPWAERTPPSAAAAAMLNVDWKWVVTRYNDDTEAKPVDPARYMLHLKPDGTARFKVDCNAAGGEYRLDGKSIAIRITHSTMAACEPGSLEGIFRRDLAAAGVYFMRGGKLYLDLWYGSGTMEFDR